MEPATRREARFSNSASGGRTGYPEAAALAIESGHQQFSVLGAIERDAVVISLRTDGPMRPLDLTEREERARLVNRLASSVRVEATSNYSMLRLEFAASRG